MTDPTLADPRAGELLDARYRLERRIGAGGMATVYLATDETLGRQVAVKLFRSGATEATDTARTASETRLLASLNHPALVTLFDARVTTDDGSYLVMEHIDGPTLAQRVGETALPEDEVASMAVDLAEALHTVHAARVVHRDIKPSNVLLRPSITPGPAYRAKLADFGIAYLIDSTRMTAPGALMGTVAYLSPELVRGADPATPADIYALGLVLLESLTGRRAYPQTSTHDSLMARLNAPPVIPGELGYAWKSLLTAMTAADPQHRPTALEVATLVRRMSSSTARPDPSAGDPDATEMVTTPTTPLLDSTGPTELLAATPTPTATTVLYPEAESQPAPEHQGSPESDRRTRRSAGAGKKRSFRRWAALAVVLLLVVVALIIFLTTRGAPAAPELPTLPDPLSTHLEELMQEVTP